MIFRDMFLVSFDRSEVPTQMERGHLLLKFRFRVECSLFSAKTAFAGTP
jgi:hypothetical protein